jgi:D-aspartate ligase
MTPAVVLGLSPTGLYAVRELGRAGIPVTGVASEFQAGCASRYLKDCIVEPDPVRRLQRLIDRFSGQQARPVLIPTSDQDIEFITAHTDRLGPHFAFQQSYRDGTAEVLLTKERFYALCEEHGVAYPRLWKSLPSQIESLKRQIDYPCMIKPSRIHEIKSELAGKKGWIVEDERDFDDAVSDIPEGAGLLLLQEIVPGPESEITLYTAHFDAQGNAHQAFSAQKVRQYPPGFGSASLVRSTPEPESQQIADRLLKCLGYRGIAAAEFKRDPRDGQLKIIEMNARPSLWFSASTAAGKFVTLASYHELAQTGVRLEELPQLNDVCWRYVGKDLYSAAFYRVSRHFVLPPPDVASVKHARKRVSAVFVSDDPAPVLAEVFNMLRKLVRPLFLKSHRKPHSVEHGR